MSTILEIQGQKGKLVVVEDPEVGHVFAVIPYGKRATPTLIRELRERTLDPWRYVEGVGFVLDLTAWKSESQLGAEEIKNKVEKYRETIDEVVQMLEEVSNRESEERKAKKKKKKRKKTAGRKRRKRRSK